MTRVLEPKFDDCLSCKHFVSSKCRRCQVGEFFEPEDEVEEPTDDDLMTMFQGMSDDD
jgi:hypothetical protein